MLQAFNTVLCSTVSYTMYCMVAAMVLVYCSERVKTNIVVSMCGLLIKGSCTSEARCVYLLANQMLVFVY